MGTPDGIRTEDWDIVHQHAVDIVNAGDAQRPRYTQELPSYLNTLETEYGPLPCILATRADYLERDDPAREALVLRSHATAEAHGDVRNLILSAQSLVELFLEWQRLPEADRWLNQFRAYVDRSDQTAASYADYERLHAAYRRLAIMRAERDPDQEDSR